jgi:hypothetical protein
MHYHWLATFSSHRRIGRPSRGTIALLALIGLPRVDAQSQTRQDVDDARWITALRRSSACTRSSLIFSHPKEIDASSSCILAETSIRQISEGRAVPYGVSRGDTAHIAKIHIMAQSFKGLNGAADRRLWLVEIAFSNGRPALSITFDRIQQSIRTDRSEHGDRSQLHGVSSRLSRPMRS